MNDTILFNHNFDNSSIFDSLIKKQKLKQTEEQIILEILKSDIDRVDLNEITSNIMNLLKNNINTALEILEIVNSHDIDLFYK
jgi:PBP1b-binding outer membrane lipoprotein LpoB